MIWSLWCRLTGGHVWQGGEWSGVAYCDRCGSLKFGTPAIPAEVWRRLAEYLVAEIAAGRITLPKQDPVSPQDH
jgi:hypothetical protein